MIATLPRTFVLTVDREIKRFNETAEHLNELGIPWERFDGIDNQLCRLNPVDTFDFDRTGDRIAPKHVAACLSHWTLWKVMSYLPENEFLVLEYDVRLADDWQEQYSRAMSVIPDDWDVLFLGSCCTAGRETTHIAENVYEVKYPLCGHAIAYRKPALSVLLREHQRIYAPLDIALYHGAFPKLRVYTVLPAIVHQHGTWAPA